MLEPRRALGVLALIVAAAGVTACTVSENRYPLALSAADAPKAWGPIRQCAQQRNYKIQDVTKDPDPRLNLWIDSASTLEISYTLHENQLYMDVVVWGDATDADRKRLIEDLKTKGYDVWTCAQQIGFNAPPPAATATPATPAPPAATTH